MAKFLSGLVHGIEIVVSFLNKISIVIGVASVGGLVIVAFAGTLMRYVFHSTFVFADEWGGYLLVIMSFIGLTYTFKEGSHSVVDYAVEKLPGRISGWIKLTNGFFNLAYIILLLIPTVIFVKYSFETVTRSYTSLRTPLAPIQAFMPIGLGLLAVAVMLEIGKKISRRSSK